MDVTGGGYGAAMSDQEAVTRHADDDWTCVCGNTPNTHGFYAYGEAREVEPVPGWGGLYFCAGCNRVIDPQTGIVVDRPALIVTLEGVELTW
ncbi:MAG: hypothetical protein QG597_2518 [Actinomycetota bacterium]|nr:hypothetical protein [Actinomycetota bacterium]